MTSKSYILGMIPDREIYRVITSDQSTEDIVSGILAIHDKYKDDYDLFSEEFAGDTVEDTAENIWRFLRKNVPYYKESRDLQTVRGPRTILTYPGDCKSYSLFAGGVIDSLNRKGILDVPFAYRFASYDENKRNDPGHVFLVLYPGSDDEIWIDPVPEISYFDEHLEPVSFKDKIIKPMSLVEISGMARTVNNTDPIAILDAAAYQIEQERLQNLQSGFMGLNSPMDLRYQQALREIEYEIQSGAPNTDAEVINGAMGVISIDKAFDIGKGILDLFGKKKKDPGPSMPYIPPYNKNDPDSVARQSDGWNYSDKGAGHQFGWAAADVILNGRPDIEPIQTLRWLSLNGIDRLMLNTEWGRQVTKQGIIDYFIKRGRPLTADEKQMLGLANASTGLSTTDQVTTSTGGKNNTLLLVGAGALVFLLMNKK